MVLLAGSLNMLHACSTIIVVALLCFSSIRAAKVVVAPSLPVGVPVFSWEELDARPIPTWYDEAKFGIFLHWGLFSVPGYEDRSLYNHTERSNFAYMDYAHRFQAELYNASYWSTHIFAASGAQYVVLTSKHHEGYCMWDSRNIATTWNWNVMDIGPQRDLLGELAKALQQTISPYTNKTMKFGVYHSLFEWFNPLFLQDQKNNFTTNYFVDYKTGPEMYDLVTRYEPDLFWSDGDWVAHSPYWKSREFLSWYGYNSTVASTAVWNDRWGLDTTCKHGSFITCQDKYQPKKLIPKKWEQCNTVDKTAWAYNRKAVYDQFRTIPELINMLIAAVSTNGNLLLNVGPAPDGTIHPIFVDRLLGIGGWLKVNGPAIYGTHPWSVCTSETNVGVYYTTKQSQHVLYAHVTKWPHGNVLELTCPLVSNNTLVYMLGLVVDPDDDDSTATVEYEEKGRTLENKDISETSELAFLTWGHRTEGSGISITLPSLTPDRIPCQHAWVLVITGIGNL